MTASDLGPSENQTMEVTEDMWGSKSSRTGGLSGLSGLRSPAPRQHSQVSQYHLIYYCLTNITPPAIVHGTMK